MLIALADCDNSLAGADSDAYRQSKVWVALVEVSDYVDNVEAAANSPLRIVSVGPGCTKHGYHSVADELFYDAVVAPDALADRIKETPQALANILRVRLVGFGRGTDKVSE